MTTYNSNAGYGLTVKVDYADPAGGFAGWFLHTINDPGYAPITNGTDAGNAASDFDGANAAKRIVLHDSVKARLTVLFGTDASVRWSITMLQGITPAVLDDSY